MNKYLNNLLVKYENKYAHETEFLQSLRKMLASIEDCILPKHEKLNIVERLIEPDKIITFRVSYLNDKNEVCVHNAYRTQHNALLGPYKGGMRFTPSVNSSIIKFLAFEQTFKNALTGLPLGGGKGGSDFDPQGKSDGEIIRFCQALMTTLYQHIGQFLDVPAGDIGVSDKEVGYMYGMYKKLTGEPGGVFTGKNPVSGGSLGRKEATGYGLCFFVEKMLDVYKNETFKGKKIVVSGSGNVGIHTAEKAVKLGAKVVAVNDISGCIVNEKGLNIEALKELKNDRNRQIKEYINLDSNSKFYADPKQIWGVKCDMAFPCATQNELNLNDAKKLVKNGCFLVAEGANMPVESDALEHLKINNVLFAPGKAANAGGVAASGLEMSQNSMRLFYTFEEVETKLKAIMENIFMEIYETAKNFKAPFDLQKSANICAFLKLAEAMENQGII